MGAFFIAKKNEFIYNVYMTKIFQLFIFVLSFFFFSLSINAQALNDQKILYPNSPIDRARYIIDGYDQYCEGYPTGTKGYCSRIEMRTRYASTPELARFIPNYNQSFSEFKGLDLAQYGGGYGIFGVAYPDGKDGANTNSNYYNKNYSNVGYSMFKLTNWADKKVPFVDIQSGAGITSPLFNITLATGGKAQSSALNLRVGKDNNSEALSIWNESDRASISVKSVTGKTTELKNDTLIIDGVDVISKFNNQIGALSNEHSSMMEYSRELSQRINTIEEKKIVEVNADIVDIVLTDEDVVIVNCSCKITLPTTNNFVGKTITIKNIKNISSIQLPLTVLGKIDRASKIEWRSYMRAIEFIWDGDEWFTI